MKGKIIGVIVFLLMVNVVNAEKNTGKLSNDMVKSFVEYRLIKSGLQVSNNIKVNVADQTITLTGVVPTLAAERKAVKEAQKVEENYKIVNDLILQPSNLSDSQIAENVSKRIDNYLFYDVFDWVVVQVQDGVVTLSGWAHLPWSASQINSIVEKVEGVQGINNNIQKETGSDELRYRAARVIYSNHLFERYAYLSNPPVHIIVNGPNITLEGTVDSELERDWAETLVSFGTDVLHVTNDLMVVKE